MQPGTHRGGRPAAAGGAPGPPGHPGISSRDRRSRSRGRGSSARCRGWTARPCRSGRRARLRRGHRLARARAPHPAQHQAQVISDDPDRSGRGPPGPPWSPRPGSCTPRRRRKLWCSSTSRYLQFILPGTLVMAVLLVTTYAGVGLNTDVSNGISERFRALPIWRPSHRRRPARRHRPLSRRGSPCGRKKVVLFSAPLKKARR